MEISRQFKSLKAMLSESTDFDLYQPLNLDEIDKCVKIDSKTYNTAVDKVTGVKVAITLHCCDVKTKIECDGLPDNVIYIAYVDTPEENRGKGFARQTLTRLLILSDSIGVTTRLMPESKVVPRDKLESLYQSVGYSWVSDYYMER